jgi:hypothetical protein
VCLSGWRSRSPSGSSSCWRSSSAAVGPTDD